MIGILQEFRLVTISVAEYRECLKHQFRIPPGGAVFDVLGGLLHAGYLS